MFVIKKIILLPIFSVILFFFILINGFTVAKSEQPIVFDYSQILSSGNINSLTQLTEKYDIYDMSVIYLTSSDTEGKSSKEYAHDFYLNNNFNINGILLFIDMDNKNVRIDTFGKCISAIKHDDIEQMLDETSAYVTNGQYYEFFVNNCESSINLMAKYKEPINYSRYIPSKLSLIVSCILTVLVVIFLIRLHGKANKIADADIYLKEKFGILNKRVVFVGDDKEILEGYYREQQSHNYYD